VTVYTITSLSGAVQIPSSQAAATAATDEINAHGGLNGHPIHLVVCDTASNANSEVQCVRQATSSNAVAIDGQIVLFNPAADWALLEAAKMPIIGDFLLSPQGGTDPNSYPLIPSGPSSYSAAVAQMAAHGCSRVGLLLAGSDANQAPTMAAGASLGAKWKHVKVLPVSVTPATTPDFAPYVDKVVTNGAQCIVFESGNPSDMVAVQKAAAANAAHPLVTLPGIVPPISALKAAGSASNGLLLVGPAPYPGADVGTAPAYRAAVAKYVGSGATLDTTGLRVWSGFQALAQVAKGLKPITRSSLAAAFSHAVVDPGFGSGTIDFSKPGYDPSAPQIKNPSMFAYVYENGSFVPDQKVGSGGVLSVAPAYGSGA
jgi:branched-chain amino acid transport system substrate-binding protein